MATLKRWQREELQRELNITRSKHYPGQLCLQMFNEFHFDELSLARPTDLLMHFLDKIEKEVRGKMCAASDVMASETHLEWKKLKAIQLKIKGEQHGKTTGT